MQKYYECGCCDAYHRLEYTGDCRNDAERFADIPWDAEVVSPAEALTAVLKSWLTAIDVNPEEGLVEAKGRHGYFKVDRLDCWQRDTTRVRIEAYAKRSGKVPPMVLEMGNPVAMRALAQYLWRAADSVEAALATPTKGA